MKKKYLFLFILIAFILLIFYDAVLSRNPNHFSPKLDLFWSYRNINSLSFRSSCLNILCFVPLGILVGLISDKHKILLALIVGLLVSLTIELSQLICARGVFDVDDLFNNSLGAVVGGVTIVLLLKLMNRQ